MNTRDGRRGAAGPVALAAAVHVLLYLLVHRTGVLGQVPVLDGRELLELAWRWGQQGLGGEPFYRAPLYPLLLSLPVHVGLPEPLLMPAAQLFNGLCHGLNAGLVAALGQRLWTEPRAGWLAGLLYAFYPVAVFFAGEPLDVTLAITLMLASLYAWVRAVDSAACGRWAALAAAGLVLAFLARPQLLAMAPVMALTAPALLAQRRAAASFLAMLTAGLVTVAAANKVLSGEFRVLPTQGGYNLWAANGPEANGRFFVQTLPVYSIATEGNPNRIEGRQRYRSELDIDPGQAVDDAEVSRYWTRRTLDYVLDEPLHWLRLEGVKLAALASNHEQYNNKTYGLQKSLNPVLAWNPLGWLSVLLLAALGVIASQTPGRALMLAPALLGYVLGLMLTYLSSRFRLPLAPLLCVLAGGLAGTGVWQRLKARAGAVIPGLAALALAGLWPWSWARIEATAAEDWLLQASAASRLGRDGEAAAAIDRARALRPDDPKVDHLHCSIGFNALINRLGEGADPGPTEDLRAACAADVGNSRGSRWAHGVLAWRQGDAKTALAEWRELSSSGEDGASQRALASLLMTGHASAEEQRRLREVPAATREGLALFATEAAGDGAAGEFLAARYPSDWLTRQRSLYARLFSPKLPPTSDEEPDG